MEEYKHNFKKKFGQNFLKDENIITKIVNSASIEENALIIEIGPGSGALTKELIKKGNVIAYEIDKDLENPLLEKFGNNTNIRFIFDDFLNRNVKKDIEQEKYNKLYVVANLPYYITTPIITKLIEEQLNVEKIVVMVQKEVGDRFSALPKTKDYSSITVFLNYYFEIKKLFVVSRNNFYPRPNVDSIIISLKRKEKMNKAINETLFFKLVRDSFQYKRKNLRNNLKQYNLEKIEEVLKKYGKDLTCRAEELTLEHFIEISNNL